MRDEAARLETDPGALGEVTGLMLEDRPEWAELLLFIDQFEEPWGGPAIHADTLRLRACIISRIVFRRGTGREAAGVCCAAAPGTTNRRTLTQ